MVWGTGFWGQQHRRLSAGPQPHTPCPAGTSGSPRPVAALPAPFAGPADPRVCPAPPQLGYRPPQVESALRHRQAWLGPAPQDAGMPGGSGAPQSSHTGWSPAQAHPVHTVPSTDEPPVSLLRASAASLRYRQSLSCYEPSSWEDNMTQCV